MWSRISVSSFFVVRSVLILLNLYNFFNEFNSSAVNNCIHCFVELDTEQKTTWQYIVCIYIVYIIISVYVYVMYYDDEYNWSVTVFVSVHHLCSFWKAMLLWSGGSSSCIAFSLLIKKKTNCAYTLYRNKVCFFIIYFFTARKIVYQPHGFHFLVLRGVIWTVSFE